MSDNRISLPAEFKLCGVGSTVVLKNEVGRGATCIAYDALQIDNFGVGHRVRVKECYPINLLLSRDATGNLTASPSDAEIFIKAKRRFANAYEKNALIKNTFGLANSTVNSVGMIECNNTLYQLMSFDEGSDYKTYRDADLRELLRHVKSLAVIIVKYHANKYLHLDIKPENMLVIPETAEHIMLFDFDSLISIDELRNNAGVILSYSDGFAAPEQVQGKLNKIDFRADIYAVGAVLFYKLFNRKATFDDGKFSARFDFAEMNYSDKRYPPLLYKKLEHFFRKTIALSPHSRRKNMADVVTDLNELIELADIERIYVIDSFSYNTANFIGRNDELASLHEILRNNQLVFVSGIGGIGKTELAKKYAKTNRGDFDTVIFCRYSDSIVTVVCNEILINGIEQEVDEPYEKYFARKISVLRETLTPKDLIILDNFDRDDDENLETLFSLPCKFIVTTREDFSDYNFAQHTLDKIKNPSELAALFKTYNDTDYGDDEWESIQKIIRLVDNHTMTVELTAKYLRETGERPEILLEKLLEVEGITGVEDAKVKQRKDLRLRSATVTNHLRALFNLSKFSAGEQNIMCSLSLLGGVKISKTRFAEMLGLEDFSLLDKLVKRGWLECDAGKISLHQIILDLCFVDLKPCAENCPQITAAMTSLIKKKSSNQTERRIKNRLAEIFMIRVTGNNLPYAELCACYGKKKYLPRAEEICLASTELEAFDILQRLYRHKIKFTAQIDFSEPSDSEEMLRRNLIRISELVDAAKSCCDAFSTEPDYVAENYSALAFETDEAINSEIVYIADDDFSAELNLLYEKIIKILDTSAENLFVDDKILLNEKIALLEKIRDFYDAADYCAMYRSEHFFNPEKQYFYQSKIDELRGEDDAIYLTDLSLYDLAENCEAAGDFDKAIDYYRRAYECGELYDLALYRAALTCRQAGYTARAIEYLEQILEIDRQNPNNLYTNYACLPLIDIFIDEKNFPEAKKLAYELLEHNGDENDEYATEWRIVAYFKLFSITNEENFWLKAVENYRLIDTEKSLSGNLTDFLKVYAGKLSDTEQDLTELENLVRRLERYDRELEENIRAIFEQAIQLSEKHVRHCIKFLTDYSLYLADDIGAHFDEALSFCDRAQQLFDVSELADDYFQSLIYRTKIICLLEADSDRATIQELRMKCDYFLLTARELDGLNDEKKLQKWHEAARQYELTDDYRNQFRCLEECLKLTADNFDRLWSFANEVVGCLSKLKDIERARSFVKNLYAEIFRQYLSVADKTGFELPRKLKDTAEMFGRIESFNEALSVYMLSACASLEVPETLANGLPLSDEEKIIVCEKFERVTLSELTAEQTDFVAEIIEAAVRLPIQDAFKQKCSELFAGFTKKHQFSEVEFKFSTSS